MENNIKNKDQKKDNRMIFKDEENLTIGQFIRKRRDDLDLTQVDIAHRLGVNVTTVCKWERNGVDIPGGHYINLGKVLNVNPMDLLKISDRSAKH